MQTRRNSLLGLLIVTLSVALSLAASWLLTTSLTTQNWKTIEYTYKLVENTRTDLGANGSSSADVDLIRGTLLVDGHQIGNMTTFRSVIDAKEKDGSVEEERLALSVLNLPGGTIHVQTLYIGVVGQSTKGHDEVAIVGGTGAYVGARGEMSWILQESGNRILKLHYTLD